MTCSHRVGAVLLVLAGFAITTPATRLFAQQADPTITFLSPEDRSYVSGPTVIRVRLEPIERVRSVSVFADGRLVCSLEQPPYECAWHAGGAVVEHVIRAAVTLTDGRRMARSIRTSGVEHTEAVDVDVVQLTAVVTDEHGQFVRGLKREAFRVFEDGARQSLTTFSSEDAPLELVVAVDFSGSMKDAMPTVRAAIKQFLAALRPTDRVTMLAFNNAVFTVAGPGADLVTKQKAVDRLMAWGGTALYDVLFKAAASLGKQVGRRAIVVFSDGEDLHSRLPIETLERQLESSDSVIYAIGQGRAAESKVLRQTLERLADKSGGQAYFEPLERLDDVFRRIVADLSNQYLLGYPPPNARHDGRWHDLRVEVPGTTHKIRARKGYRAPKK